MEGEAEEGFDDFAAGAADDLGLVEEDASAGVEAVGLGGGAVAGVESLFADEGEDGGLGGGLFIGG